MITWAHGTVTHIVRTEQDIQEVEVEIDGEKAWALHYPQWFGMIEEGERVLLNTTAGMLGLGSGGYHFVSARLDEKGKTVHSQQAYRQEGHIMKGRYTPFQHAVMGAEEEDSPHHEKFVEAGERTLGGTPVVVGELHSMLPVFALALNHRNEGKAYKLVYIMSEGGAQPLALSTHVRELRRAGVLTAVVTYGHGFGGDSECVNIYTALAAARLIWQADAIIVAPGPGTVGTATSLGFSGMEQVAIVQAVHHLGGIPILLPRVSGADRRRRHQGISHHTRTVLRFLRNTPLVLNMEQELAYMLSEQSSHHVVILHEAASLDILQELEATYPIPLSTMKRTVTEDRPFFAHAYYTACFLQAQFLEKQVSEQRMDFSSPLWFNNYSKNNHYVPK